MGVHAAPESAAAPAAAVVSWPVSSSKKTSKLTYGKVPFHSTVSLPPRHMSVFIQLQSINSEVKDIFQWRETTHEPTLRGNMGFNLQ